MAVAVRAVEAWMTMHDNGTWIHKTESLSPQAWCAALCSDFRLWVATLHLLIAPWGYSSTNLAVRYGPARVIGLYALYNCLSNRVIVWRVQDIPAGWNDVQVILTW